LLPHFSSSNVKVDLEHPPIDDIPPVDTSEPEVELNKKIVLPSLDTVLSVNAPDIDIKTPQILNIPDSSIQGEIKLLKKILDEPENTYEPPQIDFDLDLSGQPPLISELISENPESPIIVESKANKPDIAKLRKASMSKEDNSSNIESPIVSLKGPNIKTGGYLSLGFGPLSEKLKLIY
jgi:hypothetical protein